MKFLDAAKDLSVQVHPNDAQAARLVPPDAGKTEAWVVLATEAGGTIYAGLMPGVDRRALADAIAQGTCSDLLHRFVPAVGDCVFLPAGTVHALGRGLLVAEIQQSSDVTYRLFDWNRVGPDGKPRRLHVQEGLDVVDFARDRFFRSGRSRRGVPASAGWSIAISSLSIASNSTGRRRLAATGTAMSSASWAGPSAWRAIRCNPHYRRDRPPCSRPRWEAFGWNRRAKLFSSTPICHNAGNLVFFPSGKTPIITAAGGPAEGFAAMKMLHGAVIGLFGATLWCGCLAPPNITHPGSAEYQQKRAQKFDPYPETDIGVRNGGLRPSDFETPPPEVLRGQQRIP